MEFLIHALTYKNAHWSRIKMSNNISLFYENEIILFMSYEVKRSPINMHATARIVLIKI